MDLGFEYLSGYHTKPGLNDPRSVKSGFYVHKLVRVFDTAKHPIRRRLKQPSLYYVVRVPASIISVRCEGLSCLSSLPSGLRSHIRSSTS